MKIYRAILAVAVLGVVAAAARHAGAGFVVDDFQGYSLSPVNTIGNNWGAGDDTVVVTNVLPVTASKGVFVPERTTVSNRVSQAGASYPHIWTEYDLYDSGRVIPGTEPTPNGTECVMMGISTGGYVIVYDPSPGVTNWVTYTNDVWGTNMAIGAGTWAKLSVFQNFTNSTAAVFLGGHLLKEGLPFISNSLGTYGSFKFDGGNTTNSYLDNVIINNAIPPSLTNMDLDNDGVMDATEIETYGNMTTFRRLTNTVSATGLGSINPTGTFTVTWNTNVTYVMTGAEAYVVGALTNNGVVSVFGAKTAVYTDSSITNDRTIIAAFIYDGTRFVPDDHTTITGALAVAQANDRIVVSNGIYTGSFALSNGVTVVGTNMSGSAPDLTVEGAMSVVTGSVNLASGVFNVTGAVTVAAGGLLTVSNTAVNFGGLTVGSGGFVQVVNGTATVNGVTMTGTFTLDTDWNATVTPSTLNVTDGFEDYPDGTALRKLGHFGWTATSTNAVVQNLVTNQGARAAVVPASVLVSNTVSAAGITNVWTEFYLNETAQVTPSTEIQVNTNSAVMVFFETNGYLTVYNPALTNWDVCSNDVMNKSVSPVITGAWARISIFQNFSNHTAAIFLNDRLLREQVRFISTALSHYGSLNVDSGPDGTAYLDDVKIWTNAPGLIGDIDSDGILDSKEIPLHGSIWISPVGSVFSIR
jgi:hypothetical protein